MLRLYGPAMALPISSACGRKKTECGKLGLLKCFDMYSFAANAELNGGLTSSLRPPSAFNDPRLTASGRLRSFVKSCFGSKARGKGAVIFVETGLPSKPATRAMVQPSQCNCWPQPSFAYALGAGLAHCARNSPILRSRSLSTVRSRRMGRSLAARISFLMASRAACTGWS